MLPFQNKIIIFPDLSRSRRSWFRFEYCGILRNADQYIGGNVSEQLTDSTFGVFRRWKHQSPPKCQ